MNKKDFDSEDFDSDDRTRCYKCNERDYDIKVNCSGCDEKFHEECFSLHDCMRDNQAEYE